MRTKLLLTVALLALGYFGGVYYPYPQTPKVKTQQTAPLSYLPVGLPLFKDIQKKTRFIALVKPLNSVDIKPQVAGEIKEVLFTDGQEVKEGDILFRIDPDKYQANLLVAKASLAKAEADLKQLKNDFDRQESLYKDKVISTADLEKSESLQAQASAMVKQAQANLRLAEIDMEHTEVKSPIKGRIGQALITKGNYVDLSTGPLARIVQTTPVKISFSITDKEHLQMLKMLRNKELEEQTSSFQIELADKTLLPLPINKIYLDNELDLGTATINLYAEYDNTDSILVPNNHVTVLWQKGDNRPTVLVPQTALYNDQNGSYVMKLNPDNIVVQQYVKTATSEDGYIALLEGLKETDKIVLSGGQKLKNGQQIQPIETEAN